MNDAAISFALIALLALGWPVAFVAVRGAARLERERNEQREHIDYLLKCDSASGQTISRLKEALEAAQDRNHDQVRQLAESSSHARALADELGALREALRQASKNDHRDNKGRFAKAG